MVSKLKVSHVDDLDGTEATKLGFAFALDRVEYEIDLSDLNFKRLLEGLEPYLNAARRVGPVRGHYGRRYGKRGASSTAPGGTSPELAAAIRAWAPGAGLKVAGRGRIPASVVKQYEHAQDTTRRPATGPSTSIEVAFQDAEDKATDPTAKPAKPAAKAVKAAAKAPAKATKATTARTTRPRR
jgi:nucleoid-associated protein Lsr2